MILFLIRRLLLVIPVLLGLLLLTFVMIRMVPTDPAAALAGENATAAQIAAIRTDLGLDRPVVLQFLSYLGQVLQGDFGVSLYSNRAIGADILQRLPATLELTFVALIFAAVGGIAIGTAAAVWHNSWFDHLIRLVTVAGLAMASFWLAIMLQFVFSMDLGWLPLRGRLPTGMTPPMAITGLYTVDSILTLNGTTLWASLRHLALPGATLAFGGLATVARFTRSSLLETLQNDYITYERAVGFPRWRIVLPYALRNSLVSPLNQIGLLFGGFISGAVVVEAIFDWPGLGSYLVGAILTADFNATLAVTLVVGVIYALVNIAVDLVQGLIDPRIGKDL
ncbi:ABC transporter permease [Frigidibacter sp. MR17.24]|uniref:ABC transporter permease n=1 Tax=Frigidibacter sp. MR17.24 TaxID=3127345 RepID=UPI003012D49D